MQIQHGLHTFMREQCISLFWHHPPGIGSEEMTDHGCRRLLFLLDEVLVGELMLDKCTAAGSTLRQRDSFVVHFLRTSGPKPTPSFTTTDNASTTQ